MTATCIVKINCVSVDRLSLKRVLSQLVPRNFENVSSCDCGQYAQEVCPIYMLMKSVGNQTGLTFSRFPKLHKHLPLALATATKRKLISHYPDCGTEKFRLLLNCIIEFRHPVRPVDDNLNILFCYYGEVKTGETPNHFVPLTLSNNKRKFPQASTSSKMSKTK